jgi:hypothetical protein
MSGIEPETLTEASHVLYHSPALMLVCFRKNRDNLAFVTSISQFYKSYLLLGLEAF